MDEADYPEILNTQDVNPNLRQLDKQRLIQIDSLKDGFRLFGVHEGDRIDTRDLVIMTSTIEDELKQVKNELQEKRDYDAAAHVRDRLSAIRNEFELILTDSERQRQAKESINFDKATLKLRNNEYTSFKQRKSKLDAMCQKRIESLARTHELQRQNLEEYIENTRRPSIRYSKGLLDAMHSEKHMRNLNQFEEAKSLDRHISRDRPKEIAKHEDAINHKFKVLRNTLKARQEFEVVKLKEKLHDLRLRQGRAYDQSVDKMTQRIKNHKSDMSNRHHTAGAKTTQFCHVRNGKVRPVVKQRRNYEKTDASFRGTQLLKIVQGDAIKDVISLCKIHDFSDDHPEYESKS
mmetsp:Transcript_11192/g.20805  ORF Transcript_11192/g.20805 Transcript_11192/m.20805 type:complete len:348 (-) Transcript_11192:2348-3391(-)